MLFYMKIVKRKKRKVWPVILLISLLVFRIVSILVLSIITNQLTVSIQATENRIEELHSENNALRIDIQGLQNKDRIYTIANEEGMIQQNNTVVVKN